MVSMQGVYPFFDYDFTEPNRVFQTAPRPKTYPSDSVMAFLQKNFPLFAFLVQRARLDWQFADPSFRGTVWVPQHLDASWVWSADIDTARRAVKYHLMIGFFPKNVLFTSPYQELNTSIKGQTIRAVIQGPDTLLLNDRTIVTQFDIWRANGIVHVLREPLYPLSDTSTTLRDYR